MLAMLLNQAAYIEDEQEQTRIICQLACDPGALEVLVKALRQPSARRQTLAIRALRLIGYPRNAGAIPDLILHLGNLDFPGWDEVVQTLTDMGPGVVVPYLIEALWDGERHNIFWSSDVRGICEMLCRVDREYAVYCGPTIAQLLSREDLPISLDRGVLLDVLEKVGTDYDYMLPMLIDLACIYRLSEIGERVMRFITSFHSEKLRPYRLLFTS